MGYIILQLQRLGEVVIFSVGNHLAISVAGIPFFAFTVPYMVSAYTVAIMAAHGYSFFTAVVAAIVLGIATGIFYAVMYRRLSTDSFAVFTVASLFGFDALVRSWDSVTGGVLGIAGIERPAFMAELPQLLICTAIVAAVVLLFEYIILRSSFGRALQAHRESPRLLDTTGRSAKNIGTKVIIICALLAGIAGVIGAWRIQFLDPSFGSINYFVFGLTISILADKPKVQWLFIASFVTLFVPELLRFFPLPESILGYSRDLIYAVILIALVHVISAKYTEQKRLV